jgi:hypothetical protein
MPPHRHRHAFDSLAPLAREGLCWSTRRNVLKAGLAGLAGLSLPSLLAARAAAAAAGRPISSRKAVILLWMTGGPSHLDTWDPKPDRPAENRGPFAAIPTRLPGVRICEHLPRMAAMLDRFTLVRSLDARGSNHEPNTVFQTGNRLAEARTNPEARMYPAIGSLCARFRGANTPGMPPYVAFFRSTSHLAFGGYLGRQWDPFPGHQAADLPLYTEVGRDTGRTSGGALFSLPGGLTTGRVARRHALREAVDRLRTAADHSPEMTAMDVNQQRAVDLLLGGRAREAFDLNREPEAARARYGSHLWHRQALLARRLVEAGVSFVTLDLSHHPASGTWDTHGDDIPPYGGITSGLKPLLPLFDHLITTLVTDLDERGLLDDTLVIAMGEFGRTPTMTPHDGRDHWDRVAAMALAGGGLRHGQVIGATTPDGGEIAERPVTPGDLAATIYRHMEVPLDGTYLNHQGRPVPIVEEGRPIAELW